MKPLYTPLEFEEAKLNDKLPLECHSCGDTFYNLKRVIIDSLKGRKGSSKYCSQKCYGKSNYKKQKVNCSNCKRVFEKSRKEIKKSKSGNHFCSRSCSATYNNQNKTHGTRRSKLEVWLEEELTMLYPSLEIHYNRKDTINSELDIYIPILNLAIELNGIFHYEPIFGKDKLKQIQNNDQRKFQACIEEGIELALIDVSQLKYFKPKKAKKYLDIITEIVDRKSTL